MLERSVLLAHVRDQKAFWVKYTSRGDMPPTVIAFRGGEFVGTFIAPQIDKRLGLQAADLCRRGLSADQIVAVFDAHVYTSKPGEDYEAVRARWPNGSMQQACDTNGACAVGEISDCLSILIVDSEPKVTGHTLTYDYHGKDGEPFKWTPHHVPEDSEMTTHGGWLADNLSKIMTQPTKDEELTKIAKSIGLDDPEKQRYHTDRAVKTAFQMQGFLCCGLVLTPLDFLGTLQKLLLTPKDRNDLRKKRKA